MNTRNSLAAVSLAGLSILGLAGCGSSVNPPSVVPTFAPSSAVSINGTTSPSMTAVPSGSAASQDENSEPSAEASAEGDSDS